MIALTRRKDRHGTRNSKEKATIFADHLDGIFKPFGGIFKHPVHIIKK